MAIIRKWRVTRSFLSGLAVLMIVFLPLTASRFAFADTCAPPDYTTGVHYPTGADAGMYTYDCASGLWLSAHFSYNPASGLYAPLDTPVYVYNAASGAYDFYTWVFDAPTGQYVQYDQSTATPPAGAQVVGGPVTQSISNTGPDSSNTINGDGSGSISNTGPSSDNTLNLGGNSSTLANNQNNLTLNNLLTQGATSGNSIVLGNTTGGSASTGNATDLTTMVNLLQSSSSALGSGNVVTFVTNIDGDVNGDLLFDPSALGTVQNTSGDLSGNNNLTVNNSTDAAINNNLNLAATSGTATVDSNTNAGDATSGSAQVVANVINLINSAISAGQSFIGTININGNLNGDILLPPNLIDQLLADNVPQTTITITNTGPSSTNTVNNPTSNDTTVTNTNNQGITNNIDATATSGSANVAGNTSAGSASSGTASTSITAFNLTGSQVLGRDAILVFINVTGQWVGFIVNAPPGTTAAALGGGISTNSTGTNTTNLTNTTNQSITNNITANANSGNANVTNNTNAGNAKTGDANVAVNLLNVQNSSLSLADWFGILFINVFGSWHGSFGVNTSAGDPVVAIAGVASGSNPAVFNFVPGGLSPSQKTTIPSAPGSFNNVYGGGSNSANVSGTTSDGSGTPLSTAPGPVSQKQHTNWWLAASGASLFFVYLAFERLFRLFSSARPGGRLAQAFVTLRHFLF
jgi:hypothetical protein